MAKVKWLTKTQIKKAAKTSLKAAAKCSLEHWNQSCEAMPEELGEAYKSGRLSITCDQCALCHRFSTLGDGEGADCPRCPIAVQYGKCDTHGSKFGWEQARNALNTWFDAWSNGKPDSEEFITWRAAAGKVRDNIANLDILKKRKLREPKQ